MAGEVFYISTICPARRWWEKPSLLKSCFPGKTMHRVRRKGPPSLDEFNCVICCHLLSFMYLLFLFRVAPAAYESSQARGRTKAAAEAYATARATAPQDPRWVCDLRRSLKQRRSLTHWARPGIEPTSWQGLCQVLNPLSHSGNSCCPFFRTYYFSNFFWKCSLFTMLC